MEEVDGQPNGKAQSEVRCTCMGERSKVIELQRDFNGPMA